MNKKVTKILDDLLKLLSYICLVILFIVAIFLLFYIVSNQIARSKGVKPIVSIYSIVSESMIPAIEVYDMVVDTRVTDESSLKVGDIITFKTDFIDTQGYTITHRIFKIDNDNGITKYYTKGDNNSVIDAGFITFDEIEGKVKFIIPDLGKLQVFISSKFGWLLIVFIPALGIIMMDIYRLIKVYRIKNQIESIPRLKEVDIVREKEDNKKIRAVLERAEKVNSKNEK